MSTASTPRVLRTPQLGVNDTSARLIRLKPEGARVNAGEIVCHLETVKASFEIESPAEGLLFYCIEDGAQASLQEPLLRVCANEEELGQARRAAAEQHAARAAVRAAGPEATARARRRAAELGVDLSRVVPEGTLIQTSDVERHAASQTASVPVPVSALSWEDGRRPVVIYGAGKGGQTVQECLGAMAGWQPVAFVDDQPGPASQRHGLPLYAAEALPALLAAGVAHLALGVAGGRLRLQLLERTRALGFGAVNVIHPTAILSPSCRLGEALYVKAGAIIETGTVIGDACIIDNGVVIAHHNVIEPGCHVAPGASLGSGITIETGTIVGIGASIASGCRIGRGSIITPGSSVSSHVEPFSVIEGVPGRKIGEARGV